MSGSDVSQRCSALAAEKFFSRGGRRAVDAAKNVANPRNPALYMVVGGAIQSSFSRETDRRRNFDVRPAKIPPLPPSLFQLQDRRRRRQSHILLRIVQQAR